jgi:hypothetical protein
MVTTSIGQFSVQVSKSDIGYNPAIQVSALQEPLTIHFGFSLWQKE